MNAIFVISGGVDRTSSGEKRKDGAGGSGFRRRAADDDILAFMLAARACFSRELRSMKRGVRSIM
jgi:hypothetical protein